MIGIYSITNSVNGKRYVGKSKNIKRRFYQHKYSMKKLNPKTTSSHLRNAVSKYGIDAFRFEILETIHTLDESLLSDLEVFYMDEFKTNDPNYGYNLKRDSSTSCDIRSEVRKKMSDNSKGELNANYGNKWTDEQKQNLSEKVIANHKKGVYQHVYNAEHGKKSSDRWANYTQNEIDKIMTKQSLNSSKYNYIQMDMECNHIKTWASIREITSANPTYRRQGIYSCVNGYKGSHRGYKWEKVLKDVRN